MHSAQGKKREVEDWCSEPLAGKEGARVKQKTGSGVRSGKSEGKVAKGKKERRSAKDMVSKHKIITVRKKTRRPASWATQKPQGRGD